VKGKGAKRMRREGDWIGSQRDKGEHTFSRNVEVDDDALKSGEARSGEVRSGEGRETIFSLDRFPF
jgi:hypothetical protein